MITWLFIDSFSNNTKPSTIWFLFAFEILIEVVLLVLGIEFIKMFVL